MLAEIQDVRRHTSTTVPMGTCTKAAEVLLHTTRKAPPSDADISFMNRWKAQRDGEHGIRAIVRNITWLMDLPVSPEDIDADLPQIEGYPSLGAVKRYLTGHNVQMQGVRPHPATLENICFPAIAPQKDGKVVLLVGVGRGRIFFLDSLLGWQSVSRGQFCTAWTGLLLAPAQPIATINKRPTPQSPSSNCGSKIALRMRDGALSPKECGVLLSLLTGFHSSRVTGDEGVDQIRSVRTSRSAALPNEHPLTQKIIQLGTGMFGVPLGHCESLSVLAYKPGQEFRHHHDAFSDEALAKRGQSGNRLGTVLVYLNDDVLGGETHFPLLDVKIAPKAGRLLAWRNLNDEGAIDPNALHAGLPIYSGTKYVVAMHVWTGHFDASACTEIGASQTSA